MMITSQEELTDLLYRRLLCEVKLVKSVAPDTDTEDYRYAIVDACQQVIRTIEATQGGHKMASLRRSVR